MDNRHGFILVAQQAGQVVAAAYVSTIMSVEHGGESVWLEEIYVLPEFREQGVGSALVHAALDHARAAGYRAIDLEVDATHERAANLYERLGFVRMSRTRYVARIQ